MIGEIMKEFPEEEELIQEEAPMEQLMQDLLEENRYVARLWTVEGNQSGLCAASYTPSMMSCGVRTRP